MAIAAYVACVGLPAYAQLPTTDQLPLPTAQQPVPPPTRPSPMPTKAVKAESVDKRWQITFDNQATYFAGNGPGASTTRQIFTPVAMQLVAIPTDEWKMELGARSGYVDINQGTDAFKQHFGGWTDTSL